MFKALSRLFGSKPKPAPASRAPSVSGPAPRPESPPPPASAKDKWRQSAAQRLNRGVSAEDLCGLTPGMSPEQIRERLAFLYQRHNRAASSLDPALRDEAEFMLETLAGLREKYLA